MVEIMQSHMVMSFVSVSHGRHTKPLSVTPMFYEQLPMQPSQAEVFLRSTTSRPFLRRYKWGVNLRTSSLPIAYILLKQKKDFKAARPIISYVHFLYARLFRATAIALDLILRSACPRSFGLDTLPSILQKLTVFLQQLPGTLTLSFTIKIWLASLRLFQSFVFLMQYAEQLQNTVSSRMWIWNLRPFQSIFKNRIPSFVFGKVDHERQQKRVVLIHLLTLLTFVS